MERRIAGRKLLVKNPTGNEPERAVVVLGKESDTDIGGRVLGDPVTNGATLRVVANGTAFTNQMYVLDAAGWTAAGRNGFRYRGPTGGDADPVRKVLLERTPSGTALLKVILKGNIGMQNLAVVPPSFGSDGGNRRARMPGPHGPREL